jgi:hypothetical protein
LSQRELSPVKISVGTKIGRATVIEYVGINKNGHRKWKCLCECGNEFTAFATNLRKDNHTTSCGCAAKEIVSATHYKHGGGGTPLYSVWQGMMGRCGHFERHSVNSYTLNNYAGRGIRVCPAWQDFTTFRTWAENNGYEQGLHIDRENNEKGYEPDNCRFVSIAVSANNKRLLSSLNTSGYRGVSTYPVNKHQVKWRARVHSSLGPPLVAHGFDTPEEAAVVRDEHVIKHGMHKLGVPLNFPELASDD